VNIKRLLSKQYNTGDYIGGAKDLIMRTMFYVTGLNFILGAGTAYMVYAREWLDIKLFMILVGIFVVLCGLFEYKVVIPSNWKWINQQRYKHGEPLKEDIQKVLDGQTTIGKRLEKIEENLGIAGRE